MFISISLRMTHEKKDPACSDKSFMNIHIYKVYYVNWNLENQHLITGRIVTCEKLLNDFDYMETRKMETCCGSPGSDNVRCVYCVINIIYMLYYFKIQVLLQLC